MKQSSIEWLVTELNQMIDYIPMNKWDKIADIIQQAKQMHKEEIEDAFFGGIKDTGEGKNGEYASGNNPNVETVFRKEYEQYYNKTYGGNNE